MKISIYKSANGGYGVYDNIEGVEYSEYKLPDGFTIHKIPNNLHKPIINDRDGREWRVIYHKDYNSPVLLQWGMDLSVSNLIPLKPNNFGL